MKALPVHNGSAGLDILKDSPGRNAESKKTRDRLHLGVFQLHVFQIAVIVGIQRIRTFVTFAVALGKKLAALRLLRLQKIAVFLQQRLDCRSQHLFILLQDRIQTGKKITGNQTGRFLRLILNSGISLRGCQIVQHDEIFLEQTHESQTVGIFQVPFFNNVGIENELAFFFDDSEQLEDAFINQAAFFALFPGKITGAEKSGKAVVGGIAAGHFRGNIHERGGIEAAGGTERARRLHPHEQALLIRFGIGVLLALHFLSLPISAWAIMYHVFPEKQLEFDFFNGYSTASGQSPFGTSSVRADV